MSFPINLNIQPNNILDYKTVANDFCNLYYTTMLTRGISGTLSLFSQDALCIFNSNEFIGMYNLMSFFSTRGINKIVYSNLNFIPVLIDTTKLMIQVTGSCQFITFWNQLTNIEPFTETFILELNLNNSLVINKYILKTI
jgi:hypothetical protein